MNDDRDDAVRGAELLADLDTAAASWADARSAEDHAIERLRQAIHVTEAARLEYGRASARYDAWSKAPLT